MNWMIRSAVEAGVRSGFEEHLASVCDGYDEPQERCPMRPQDGCSCLYVRYKRLPWWRKLFTEEPKRPDSDDVLRAALRIKVEDALSEIRAREKRSQSWRDRTPRGGAK